MNQKLKLAPEVDRVLLKPAMDVANWQVDDLPKTWTFMGDLRYWGSGVWIWRWHPKERLSATKL